MFSLLCLIYVILIAEALQDSFLSNKIFWALPNFFFVNCGVSEISKFDSTCNLGKYFQCPCMSRRDINSCNKITENFRRAMFFLLLPRKEQFEKQQRHPEKKAAFVGKSLVWRRDKFSLPRSKAIQKVKVWRNNTSSFLGWKSFLFLFLPINFYLLGNWIPEPEIPHRLVKSICCSYCFESGTRQIED